MEPGVVIGERYRVVRKLGQGGMGVVYEVQHTSLDRRLALKTLSSSESTPDSVERFRREARAAASISHPNVIHISDYGVLADGTPYYVMEMLDGEDLAAMLGRTLSGVMPWREAIQICIQVCRALEAIHDLGIVHRDLKPSNIFCAYTTGVPLVKVLDFGIAKIASETTLTGENAAPGTLPYMSPQRIRCEKAEPRDDIYSLGVILYELVSGKLPYYAESAHQLVYKVAVSQEDPRPIDVLVPGEIARDIMKCMARDPENRFESALDLRVSLERSLGALQARGSSLGDTEPQSIIGPTRGKARELSYQTTVLRGASRSGGSGRAWYAALLAGAVVVTGAIFLLVPREEGNDGGHPKLEKSVAPDSGSDPSLDELELPEASASSGTTGKDARLETDEAKVSLEVLSQESESGAPDAEMSAPVEPTGVLRRRGDPKPSSSSRIRRDDDRIRDEVRSLLQGKCSLVPAKVDLSVSTENGALSVLSVKSAGSAVPINRQCISKRIASSKVDVGKASDVVEVKGVVLVREKSSSLPFRAVGEQK